MPFSSHARITRKVGWIIPFLRFPFFLPWSSVCTHQCHSFRPRISPRWLSKLRQLWTGTPWWVACELNSLMGSHTMPGQYSLPIQTVQVKGICVFSCNLLTTFLAERSGSSSCVITGGVEWIPKQKSAHKVHSGARCYCCNMGVEWIPNQKSAQKVHSRARNWPHNFPTTNQAFYHWTIPPPQPPPPKLMQDWTFEKVNNLIHRMHPLKVLPGSQPDSFKIHTLLKVQSLIALECSFPLL